MPSHLLPTAAFVASLLLFCSAAGAQPSGEDAPPEAPKVELLLEDIDRLRSEYRVLEKEQTKHEGQEQTLIVLQLRKTVFELMRTVDELVADVIRQKEEGVKRPSGLNRTRKLLMEMDRTIPLYIDGLEVEAAESRTALSEAPAESREMLAGHVELLSARRRETRKVAKASPDDPALQAAVRAADEVLDHAATSLWAISDVMDDLGLETAEHRQVLIKATGEITGDVLDVDVLIGLFDEATAAASDWLDRRGPPLLARAALFIAILALFWMLGGVVRRLVSRLADRAEHVSELSRSILVGVASRTVIVLGFFIALSQVGVNVTALLAGLGIAGFIVGFSLQNTLANFASGAMILLYRPFDVGDVIEAGGVYGKVDGMSLVTTTILTFDNQTLVVPNSKIWGDVIRNVTAQDIRRVDLEFAFSHALDVARTEEVLASILEHPKVLEDPEPLVKVHKLTDFTTRIVVRPWVKREDYWEVYWDLTREAKLRLDREGIPLGLAPHAVQLPGESSD
jgi:small conductance mechanosensitive channel